MRAKTIIGLLLVFTTGFLILYLYHSVIPANVSDAALRYFSQQEIMLAHKYWQQKQTIFVFRFALQVLVLVSTAFGSVGVRLERWTHSITSGRRYLGAILFFFCLWVGLRLISLPFSFYSGYVLEHAWGFSNQLAREWVADYLKQGAMDLLFSAIGASAFFAALRKWPTNWWLPASVLMSFWLIVQTFLWPTLVAPLYNRFEPVSDPAITTMVQDLAQTAEISVDQVLIMDASKRTSKANAYFAGLGQTKRIVLYDTLLNNYPLDQVRAVIAHEMAHWKLGHIRQGVLLGIGAVFAELYFLSLVLASSFTYHQLGHYPFRAWAVALLFFTLISFVTSPVQSALSRHMERDADRRSVVFLGNFDSAVDLQLNLARKNRSNIVPSRFIEWFSYSHPSVLKRISLLLESS